MKTIYVVYKMKDGALKSDTIEIEGKINHLTVTKSTRDHLYDDEYDFDRIISWQVEDPFTFEEEWEFLKELLEFN